MGFFLVLLSYNLWVVWEWFESNGLCYQDDNSQQPKSQEETIKKVWNIKLFKLNYIKPRGLRGNIKLEDDCAMLLYIKQRGLRGSTVPT